ncbi:hypothetical protein GCM10010222_64890 [Streptomyces tanashiensis]|uniref:hypothetical protein n=1 Tax=Streptomyces tanashiensis TaxID=67367 RepID=UPI001677D827|nr:hypothetical protein [Streptomyces tanashiensis]GGT13895.1 hypothetical protein GCM10010222_64890 [Streptomyces tanashiensis]
MKAERRGGTAPWAKVLGAVLLVPVVALVALFALSRVRESGREHDAFEATRADATRFADTLVATKGVTPSDQDVRDALDGFAGHGPRLGLLVGVRPAEHGTRVFVHFSRPYERGMSLFGPSDAMAVRCFTIELPEATRDRPRVTAHGPDVSCTTLAASTPN